MGESEQKSVGIWIRVSTEDQVRGESPEHHEKRARAYAEAKGWNVVTLYRLDAVSGKAVIAHAEAQRMLRDIQTGVISGLVFSKLARLARNTRELLEFAEIFRTNSADLISLQESIDTSSPAGRLFFTMIAAMAQWEREEIADRVRASVPIRAKMGKPIGGGAPFGYQWKEKRLVPDPDEAPVRALVHELFVEHKRKRTVARILNERGYRTRNGSNFSDTTVMRLVSDPIVKGVRRTNYTCTDDRNKSWKLKPENEWVYTDVEPIISEDLWNSCANIVASQMDARKPVTKRALYLFAGVTFCVCGTKMYVRSKSPKYVCEECRNKIPMADLEAVYREQLHHFLVSPEEIESHNAAAQEAIRGKERLIVGMESELKKLAYEEDQLFALYGDKLLSKDDFGRRHKPISLRRRQLEDEMPRLQAECDVMRIGSFAREEALGEARNLTERWGELPNEEKRQIVEAITDRIIIDKEDIEIRLLQLPEISEHVTKGQHGHRGSWRRPAARGRDI